MKHVVTGVSSLNCTMETNDPSLKLNLEGFSLLCEILSSVNICFIPEYCRYKILKSTVLEEVDGMSKPCLLMLVSEKKV